LYPLTILATSQPFAKLISSGSTTCPPVNSQSGLGWQPRALALRRHLGIDHDEDDAHIFVFDSQRITRFSDNALRKMREALEQVDMREVWREHRPRRHAA
jgi:hypothetical protein